MTFSDKMDALNKYFDYCGSFTCYGKTWQFCPFNDPNNSKLKSTYQKDGEDFEDFIVRLYDEMLTEIEDKKNTIEVNGKKYKLVEENPCL